MCPHFVATDGKFRVDKVPGVRIKELMDDLFDDISSIIQCGTRDEISRRGLAEENLDSTQTNRK